jgi:hypothetical protein
MRGRAAVLAAVAFEARAGGGGGGRGGGIPRQGTLPLSWEMLFGGLFYLVATVTNFV